MLFISRRRRQQRRQRFIIIPPSCVRFPQRHVVSARARCVMISRRRCHGARRDAGAGARQLEAISLPKAEIAIHACSSRICRENDAAAHQHRLRTRGWLSRHAKQTADYFRRVLPARDAPASAARWPRHVSEAASCRCCRPRDAAKASAAPGASPRRRR